MNKKTIFFIMLISVFLLTSLAREETVTKTYPAGKDVVIKTVSGDCHISQVPGREIRVKLVYKYNKDCFRPEFREEKDRVILKEKFESHSSCSGHSQWTLEVPSGTDVEFSSASGNLTLKGLEKTRIKGKTASGNLVAGDCSGEMNVRTASGDIELKNVSGDVDFSTASGDVTAEAMKGRLELKTASGDVEVRDASGEMELKSASGDVEVNRLQGRMELKTASGNVVARDIVMEGPGEFKTASGDVKVYLKKSTAHDLELATASGTVLLDYQGNRIQGTFEFSCKKSGGKIISPFPFDSEKEEERWGKTYLIKSFSRGKKSPHITLSTASGKVELKK